MNNLLNDKKISLKIRDNLIFVLVLSFVVFCISQLDINLERIMKSYDKTKFVIGIMFPPTISSPKEIIQSALVTIQIAVLGTFFGVFISIFLAFFAAKNLTPHISISYAVKTFAALMRAIPSLIWAIFFIIAVGLGPTPGILAIAVHSIGMLVKVYAESIEEIDMGVVEALKSTGADQFQIFMQGIFPSVMNTLIFWSAFRFDINLRSSTVLGIVGAGGLGWELMRASRMIRYDEVMGITIVIFLMITGVELLTRYITGQMNLSIPQEKVL
jgi:phosphonate transport system permease protein